MKGCSPQSGKTSQCTVPELLTNAAWFAEYHFVRGNVVQISVSLNQFSNLNAACETNVFFPAFSDLPMEYNPSDHPRASTIFLSKSQTDGEHCHSTCTPGISPWHTTESLHYNQVRFRTAYETVRIVHSTVEPHSLQGLLMSALKT